MPIIKMWVETGFAGADHEDEMEIDDAEWNQMNEEQKHKELNDIAIEYLHNCVSCGAEVKGE